MLFQVDDLSQQVQVTVVLYLKIGLSPNDIRA